MRHLLMSIVTIGLAFGCAEKTDDGSSDNDDWGDDEWGTDPSVDLDPDNPGGTDTGSTVPSNSSDISGFIGPDAAQGNEIPAPNGDISCLGASLTTETAAAGCVAQWDMQGIVLDFQTNEPVDDATVEIFQTDSTANPPDVVVESNANGMFTARNVIACQASTYRVSTDAALAETKVTIESHVIVANEGPLVDSSQELNSVSSITYALIPNLLGVSPDASKGIVQGRALDCNGNTLEGVQVVVHDGSATSTGTVPDGVLARYFSEEFPSRAQFWTSDDGLWMLLDVPPGTWTVDGYVADGAGGYTKVASTRLNVVANSVHISNLYTGLSDGVKMPDQCLSTCS